MSDYKPVPRKKNALDNRKLMLFSEPREGVKSPASLSWNVINNNPWVTVYTNDPDDKTDNGRIVAKLDITVAFALIELIKQVIRGANNSRFKMENKNFTYKGRERSDAPTVVSEIFVGKDEAGVVWLSVTATSRPRIKFYFKFNEYHRLYKADGTSLDEGESSQLIAMGYVNLLEKALSNVYHDEYKHPEDKGKGGSGSSQSRPRQAYSEDGDDIDF
jgi:hypothetical protein